MTTTHTITGTDTRYADHVVVHVEPFEAALKDGRTVVIEHFFCWTVNSSRYTEARGRVIRKDGTPGVRVLTWWDVPVPADMREAIDALKADR